MVSPRQEIIFIPKRIIGLLNKHKKQLEAKVLISHLRLKTGFSTKILKGIIEDLIIVGVLVDDDGFLKFGEEAIDLEK